MKCLKVLIEKDISSIDYANPLRAARGIVLDEEVRIGMLYMKKFDFYGFPGGEIDEGESIEEAFLREIKEEIGCDCEIIRELGYVGQNHANHNAAWTSYYFLARLAGEKGKPNYTEEELQQTISIEWHTPEEAIRLIERNIVERASWIFLKESFLIALRECFK
jgi:ADP-ribose pyrophosphatase YjhB (NUDIX family)